MLRSGRRMLLCRRRADRRSYANVWDLPGGHVEAGENDTTALSRECREELGIDVVASSGVALVEVMPGTHLSVRLISAWRGEPRCLAPEEHDEIGWFTSEEIPRLRLADAGYVPLCTALLTPSPTVEIRRLDHEAWEAVGTLHALSRQETYAPLLPARSSPRFRPIDQIEHWRAQADQQALVLHGAWDDQTLLGFVATAPAAPRGFELKALHVRPDWHGRGLADWLHRAAMAHLLGQGGRDVRLWVVERNLRARRFYEKQGWRPSGDRRAITVGGATLPAIAYARRI